MVFNLRQGQVLPNSGYMVDIIKHRSWNSFKTHLPSRKNKQNISSGGRSIKTLLVGDSGRVYIFTKVIPGRVSVLIDKSLVGYHFLGDQIPSRVDFDEKLSGTPRQLIKPVPIRFFYELKCIYLNKTSLYSESDNKRRTFSLFYFCFKNFYLILFNIEKI